MNQRERFRRTAEFQSPDRAFLLAPWPWQKTVENWEKDGLPEGASLSEFFHTDQEKDVPVSMQGRYGPHLHPPLERRILSEDDEHFVVQDEEGNVVQLRRDDPLASMPRWITYPMSGREDWEKTIKPHMDAKIPGRRPERKKWTDYVLSVKKRDYPLGVWSGSLYGWPRSLMGVENFSYAMVDDPDFVHEICEHIADFATEMIEPVLKEIDLDYAFIWEDMAGKGGPLCSPAMYRKFMGGPLTRITDLLHRYGVHNIIIDSDGQNDPLIPVWLDCGITGLRPFEIAAGSDPVAIRRQYGKNLIIQGGIDKRSLFKGIQDIEREILSKVPWLCLQGGYFPQVDHLVPPEVSFTNYVYYSDLMFKVVSDPERYLHEAIKRGYFTEP